MIELAGGRHGAGLIGREPHQFGIDGDRPEAVIAPIAGDHRLRRIGVESCSRLGEVEIEARLTGGRGGVGAARQVDRDKRCAAEEKRGNRP